MTQKLNNEQLVDFVIEKHKLLGDSPALVEAVASLGMTSGEARDVVSTVRDAYCRTMLYSAGAQPHNFHGDYETDPIFQAALKRFLPNGASLSASSSARRERRLVHSVVWAAVLVGLFAIGVVVYYAVDLWKASH